MKYFKELNESDKERALDKLLVSKHLKFTCLTRAKIVFGGNVENCSVIRYYFSGSSLKCDVILDIDLNRVMELVDTRDLDACNTELSINSRGMDDISSSKRALKTLLTSGKHYIFDDKCNAYAV